MPDSTDPGRLDKREHAGKRTAENALDWAVASWLAVLIGWAAWHLGGVRELATVQLSWMVGALVVLHAAWLAVAHRGGRPVVLNAWGLAFFPFLAYAAYSARAVTPVPWKGEEEVLVWAQGAAVYWVAVHNLRRKGQVWFVAWAVVAVALLSVVVAYLQFFSAGWRDWLPMGRVQLAQYSGRASGTFGSPNNFAALMELVVPLLLAGGLMRRLSVEVRLVCFAAAAACAFGVFMSMSRGGFFGLFVALVALPFFVVRRTAWKIALSAVVAAGLACASLNLYAGNDKVRERVDRMLADRGELSRQHLWRAGWSLFRESPWTGTGSASFDVYFERHRPPELQLRAVHTHNDYLNTLSDYGAVGFALLYLPCALLVGRGWLAWRRYPFRAVPRGGLEAVTPASKIFLGGILLGLLSMAVHLAVDFHPKIPALLYIDALFLALLVKFTAARSWTLPGGRWPRFQAALVISLIAAAGLAAALRGAVVFDAAARVREGREQLDRLAGDPALLADGAGAAAAAETLRAATEINPGNGHAWSFLGVALGQRAHATPDSAAGIGRAAAEATSRALELSGELWEFYTHHALSLDLQGRREEAWEHYQAAIALAPRAAHAWFYYAQSLAADPDRRAEAAAILDLAIRLDPRNRAALNLRKTLQD